MSQCGQKHRLSLSCGCLHEHGSAQLNMHLVGLGTLPLMSELFHEDSKLTGDSGDLQVQVGVRDACQDLSLLAEKSIKAALRSSQTRFYRSDRYLQCLFDSET